MIEQLGPQQRSLQSREPSRAITAETTYPLSCIALDLAGATKIKTATVTILPTKNSRSKGDGVRHSQNPAAGFRRRGIKFRS